jgi:hypothetical protein
LFIWTAIASENHPAMRNSPEASNIMNEADEIISSPPQGDLADSDSSIEVEKLAADMQQRCRLFLDELEQFQAYLKDQRKEKHVDLRIFRSGLQSEMKMLDKVSISRMSVFRCLW